MSDGTNARGPMPVPFPWSRYIDVHFFGSVPWTLVILWERPPVPRGMRQCEICHQGVEDEFHFVCVCPAYVHIRKKYIKQYYWKRPSMFKLVQLFNTENKKALNGLAKYVYRAFNLRKELTRT